MDAVFARSETAGWGTSCSVPPWTRSSACRPTSPRAPRARIVGALGPPFRTVDEADDGMMTGAIRPRIPTSCGSGSAPRDRSAGRPRTSARSTHPCGGRGRSVRLPRRGQTPGPPLDPAGGARVGVPHASEPRRLTGRYARKNPRFVWMIARQGSDPIRGSGDAIISPQSTNRSQHLAKAPPPGKVARTTTFATGAATRSGNPSCIVTGAGGLIGDLFASEASVHAAGTQHRPAVAGLAEADAYPEMSEARYGLEAALSERMCCQFPDDIRAAATRDPVGTRQRRAPPRPPQRRSPVKRDRRGVGHRYRHRSVWPKRPFPIVSPPWRRGLAVDAAANSSRQSARAAGLGSTSVRRSRPRRRRTTWVRGGGARGHCSLARGPDVDRRLRSTVVVKGPTNRGGWSRRPHPVRRHRGRPPPARHPLSGRLVALVVGLLFLTALVVRIVADLVVRHARRHDRWRDRAVVYGSAAEASSLAEEFAHRPAVDIVGRCMTDVTDTPGSRPSGNGDGPMTDPSGDVGAFGNVALDVMATTAPTCSRSPVAPLPPKSGLSPGLSRGPGPSWSSPPRCLTWPSNGCHRADGRRRAATRRGVSATARAPADRARRSRRRRPARGRAGPVFIAVALAVRLSSPGPILFRQPRVGQHGSTSSSSGSARW